MEARLEINLFFMILLGWVLYKLNSDADEREENITLSHNILNALRVLFADMVLLFTQGKIPSAALYILYTIYYFLLLSMGFHWFLYAGRFTKNKKMYNKENRVTYLVLVISMIILTILSPFVNLLYKVDPETLSITSGYLGKLFNYVPYVFILFATIQFIIALIYDTEAKTEMSVETVVMVIALPMLTMIFTIIFESFTALAPSLVICMLFIYFDFHVGHVSTDGLTGLNNKRQYLRYINSSIQDVKAPFKLFLIICDIDYFKHINDTFGHAEGDKAIIEIAEMLKKTCSAAGGSFLARYGGDEFVIVFKTRFDDEVIDFMARTQKALKERNESGGARYKLSMSIGYAQYQYGETLEMLTARADEMLYSEKQEHHLQLDKKRGIEA